MLQTTNNRQYHDIQMAQTVWMRAVYWHLLVACIEQHYLLSLSLLQFTANGNRESQTDANLKTTTYEYDELDRKSATIYPDTARQEYDYDENGNLIRLLDPKGQEITYQYDELNRQTLHTYPLPTVPTGDDIQTIATSYDPNNNPKEVTETYTGVTGTRVTSNQYDSFDRLISTTDAFGKSINYTYDANGNRKTVKDPDDNITRYNYDALNRVETVTNSGGVTSYSYDRSSLKTKVTYPNGTDALYSYDDAYRIETINNRHNGITVSSYSYTFDDNGNRKTQIETNGGAAETTSYDYDDNDRLEQVTYPDVITTYTYDAAYNRKTEISEDRSTSATLVNKTYNYDDRNQLNTVIDNLDNSQNVTYQYDDNGNRVIKTKNGVTNTFIYDVRDKLIELRQDAATLGNYFYDYKGMRVIKTDAGGEVRYTYDDDSVLTQSDNTNTTIAKYDYGPDRLLSLDHNTEGRQFYLFDALGSTVNLTKTDGSLQARYQYDAWGHYRSQAGASWNRFAFTGHEKDEESGLYYFKARFYDPETGRFLSQDSYLGESTTPPSLHRYLYAYANPVVYIDPTGHVPVLDEWGQFHTDTAAKLIDEAENTDSVTAAIGLGVMAGANYVVGGVVETVNFGLNIVGSDGWLGERARERATTELHQAFDTINTIVEDPKGTGTAIVTGVKETAKAAARGETKAIAQSAAVGTSLLVVRPNASVSSIAPGTANTVKSVAIGTGAVLRETGKAIKGGLAKGMDNLMAPSNPMIKQMGAIGDLNKPYRGALGQGVYVLRDPLSGEIKYVGRGDVKARGVVHQKSSDKGHLVQEILHDNTLTKPQAKYLEQRLMDEFGGAKSTNPATNLLNKIRSYSPKNPNAPKYNVAGQTPDVAEDLWRETVKQLK